MKKRILFTGGGTAGHVTPNIALMEALRAEGWDMRYVGSAKGIERSLIGKLDVPYSTIATGKLRRYFDWQNFIDPVFILWGCLQSLFICLRYRPAVVFSKGGFVAVPLVVAAWLCRVPVISHESDITPGLANKLCFPFSRWICVNFPQTQAYLPAGKVRVTGSPVRASLLQGDAERARQHFGLGGKPLLLVFGGSLGARVINQALRDCLDQLLNIVEVIHVAGAGNLDSTLEDRAGYHQLEYIHEEFGDVLAAADLALSRAGANSLYELLVTRTPHILVPLSAGASRGDQLVNAEIFRKAGFSQVLQETELNPETLLAQVNDGLARRTDIARQLETFAVKDSVTDIVDLITRTAG